MNLNLEPYGNTLYRVTWYVGDEPETYLIGAESLHDAAQKVRDQLELLSLCVKENTETRDVLIGLAQAGRVLRLRLFDDSEKKKEIGALEARIAHYYANDRKLMIYADASIGIPWGLMFDGRVPEPAQDATPEQQIAAFRGFWCLKYRLSALSKSFSRDPRHWKRPRTNFGMLSMINREVKAELAADLPQSAYTEFCEMLNPVGEAKDFEESLEMLETTPNTDMIVHFLGHQRDQTLILDEDSMISFDDFSLLLDGLTVHNSSGSPLRCGLVFLNGCESAFGKKDFTLRRHASRPELCGAIATESIVRRKYAVLFGFRFLKLLVKQGKTVADTMEELHHDGTLWPESLIYGCYAHPDYCIESPADTAGAAQPAVASVG
jgi:hypothetical protein